MTKFKLFSSTVVAIVAALVSGMPALAADTAVVVGSSGKTYASSSVTCATNPATGSQEPVVDAGLFNPNRETKASVKLNGSIVTTVTTAAPAAKVWLADGNNTVAVIINRRTADSYAFAVQPGMCDLPDTSGNTFSIDGTLEYAASGKSYMTVTPGCAFNPATGLSQPFVNLFDNGSFVLNVSVNGIPLTQLSALRPRTPVFLSAGQNIISAANGSLSIDYFVRDGGNGSCTLP